MASKQVTDRQKAANAVAATVDIYGERLRAGFTTVLPPIGGSPAVGGAGAAASDPAVSAMVVAEAAGQLLSSSIATLVAADEAHAVEMADDVGLRVARDAAASELREHLVGLRDGLVGLYGAATPGAVGFAGATPVDPVVLVRVGNEVAKGLRKKDALPAPRYKKAVIDAMEEASILEGLATKLAMTIEAVVEDVRENQVTKTARDAAMATHDATFSRTANLLSAMFAFAGEPELADRIRPSVRTPGRLASGEGEPAASEATSEEEAPVTEEASTPFEAK